MRETLGRYVLEARIARGGMGEVFRAAAIGADGFRKPVVIKRVLSHSATPALREMFVAEAKLMTRLAHPNIVEVFDFGKGNDDAYFLVMELVGGLDLRAFADSYRRAGEAFPIPLALLVAREALRGLAFAHTQALGSDKLVHRDISPGNILLSSLGEVKVADFGVALVAAPDAAQNDSLIVGKPAYMAPEQARGESLDGRADLFSLGVVLHELVAGRLPFPGEALEARRLKEAGTPRELCADRADAPAALAAFLKTALAPHAEGRFADARAMLRELDGLRASGLHAATSDELAEAVSERAKVATVEQVIVVGRDIAADQTRVERGEGGTAFTLSLDDIPKEPTHHTERLDAPLEAPSETSLPRPLGPTRDRKWFAIPIAALVATAGVVIALRLRDSRAPAPGVIAASASSETVPSAAKDPRPSPSAVTLPAPLASSAAEALPTLGALRPAPIGPSPTTSAPSAAPSSASCSGTVKLMASHGWAVRGGPSAVEAPGVYSWRCGSYNLSATSRLDDQKRGASVLIREDKQAIVDLR